MRSLLFFLVIVGFVCCPVASAEKVWANKDFSEVSFVSGVLKKIESEEQNEDSGGSTSLNIGGRYYKSFSRSAGWLAEVYIDLKSNEAAKGAADPDDDTSISGAAGYRHTFEKLSTSLYPYIQGKAGLKHIQSSTLESASSDSENGDADDSSDTDVASDGSRLTETALFYGVDIGFNLYVSDWAFFLFEVPLFESRLVGKVERDKKEGDTDVESEDDILEFYGSSVAGVTDTKVGFGIVF